MGLKAKLTKNRILAGLCLVSLVLMFMPARNARWICQAIRPVLAPLDAPGMALTVHLRARMQELTRRGQAEERPALEPLRKEIFDLQQLLERQRKQIEKLSHWEAQLKDFPCRLLPARVLFGEGLPLQDRKVVDVGLRDGLGVGNLATTRRIVHEFPKALPEQLAVLGDNYVVGRIVECAAHSATLQLVTDRQFRMSARIWRMLEPGQQRTILVATSGRLEKQTFQHDGKTPGPRVIGEGIEVWVEGSGREIIVRRQVPANHGVRPGDLVTTSDAAGYLPLGLTLGKVTAVQPDKQAAHFVTVLAEPLADLDTLREVYILQPQSGSGG